MASFTMRDRCTRGSQEARRSLQERPAGGSYAVCGFSSPRPETCVPGEEGRHILWETAFPHGKLKSDYISVREPDGRETAQKIDTLLVIPL
jgi:hypothetical protein